jgi:hypothetical protein
MGADVDVDAASSALEDLGAALGLDVAVEDEAMDDLGGEEDLEAEEELDLELEQDDMLELDMEEGMRDEGMRESDELDEADDEVL